MYKWIYDKMVEEYKKEEKIALINKIMAYSEIEVSDRAFANQCCAGTAIYNINQLFEYLTKNEFRTEMDFSEIFNNAVRSWNFIKGELAEIKRDTRVSEKERDFMERVIAAKNEMDVI